MKFKKHYLISILLSCGATLAMATESETEIQDERQHTTTSQQVAAVSPATFPKEIFRGEELPIVPFPEEEGEELFPASDVYESWQNSDVNPYKIGIKDLTDSIHIDCAGYTHPVTENGWITSNYGPRKGRFHYGIDLKVMVGQDIYAAYDGKVRITAYNKGGYGYYVVIRHENGFETLYGHLSEIKVDINQDVKAGDLIGLGGNTGRSTGSHLHFEVRYLGNAINPKKLIDFNNNALIAEEYTICKNTTFEELIEYQKVKYHIVKSGETLSTIARRYGTSVTRLCQLNGIKSTTIIKPKQRIRYS